MMELMSAYKENTKEYYNGVVDAYHYCYGYVSLYPSVYTEDPQYKLGYEYGKKLYHSDKELGILYSDNRLFDL
ncbi:hypothetical protein [Paenibacillus sp. TCA20]|uniref:hypothetical protein n=1 Tax=Paenibacillus sp. TCA20 TaxID=1499968 RepID=UPI000A50CB13|nr:hypothetical protein [Paenibacillus sp. TCA20]